MRRKLLLIAVLTSAAGAAAQTVDLDLIRHWSGTGPNRAALVVQFDTPGSANPGALVWGYRWEDGDEPDGLEIVTKIAGNSSRLCALVQMTGEMGYTLDGLGYADRVSDLLESLTYNLDGASADSRISFGFFDPNTSMGQTSAPGSDALDMALEAIEEAKSSHVITHPLNFTVYGYPAYDYDWWNLTDPDAGIWNSGWYDGYWSYWTGEAGDLGNLAYSGLGMSSVRLKDGDVQAWKYLSFAPDADEDPDWLAPVYVDENGSTQIDTPAAENPAAEEVFTLEGLRLSERPARGFYLVRKNGETRKYFNQ